jgi:hypothetical protein
MVSYWLSGELCFQLGCGTYPVGRRLIAARDGNRDDQLGAAGGCGMLVSPTRR